MDKLREQFLSWYQDKYESIMKNCTQDIRENHKHGAWEGWKACHEVSLAEIDKVLCGLLPGVQYMDPPDGGSVTPLEQVRRMVADYQERLVVAEQRCDHRGTFWDVSGVLRCAYCDKTLCISANK